MVLNTRKCKEILICFWKKKPNFQQLTVNNYPVEHVNSAKLLGVMLSSDLKWNEHVAYIVKKSSRRLHVASLKKSKCRHENVNYGISGPFFNYIRGGGKDPPLLCPLLMDFAPPPH